VLAIEAEANPLPWREGHFLPFVRVSAETGPTGAFEGGGSAGKTGAKTILAGADAGLAGTNAGLAGTASESARLRGNGPVHMGWVCLGTGEDGDEGGGTVLGFACAFAVADEVELQSLAVERSARGRGLGALLLEALLEWAGRQGYRSLHLEVRAGNAPALALYRRFGFAQTGTRRGYYQDNGEDALLLARDV
jgi:ribosomal-protein-alanine acetyltransferase